MFAWLGDTIRSNHWEDIVFWVQGASQVVSLVIADPSRQVIKTVYSRCAALIVDRVSVAFKEQLESVQNFIAWCIVFGTYIAL